MEYKTEDLLLPWLGKQGHLPDPCSVRITMDDKYVCLFIGPRDWQWHRETGEMIGAGTSLCDLNSNAQAVVEQEGVRPEPKFSPTTKEN